MEINIQNPFKRPCMFKVNIKTPQKMLIGVAVYSAKCRDTFYTYSKTWVDGSRVIDIRLPLCPKDGVISIWNASVKDKRNRDKGFKIGGIKKVPFTANLDVYETSNKTLKSFIKFAKEFAECKNYLSTHSDEGKNRSIYKSDDGRFVIHYVDEIIGDDGKPRKTSMRVNNHNGVMELAKKYVKEYTIPETIAILLHEFSHFYLNEVHSDEFEADHNALLIYCGLGFPRQEGARAFCKVFYRTPSDFNMARWKELKEFVEKFDRTNFKIVK